MKKRRQEPINKRVDFLSNKVNKYSIRKFTVGTASILVGATLMFGAADNEAKAAEDNQLESASKEEQKGSRDFEVVLCHLFIEEFQWTIIFMSISYKCINEGRLTWTIFPN